MSAESFSSPNQPVLVSTKPKFLVHTYSVAQAIILKAAADALFPGITERFNNDCLIFHAGDREKLFIFRFGAVVFFNVPRAAHENFLSRLGLVPKIKPAGQVSDDFAEDEVQITIDPSAVKVEFSQVTLADFDLNSIQLVALVLAQSSALEIIEWEVDEFLAESESMTRFMQGGGAKRPRRRALLRFLGSGLSTKHRIVNQLAVLNEPEKTWENEQLYQLYKALFSNFEIRERSDRIDKMLALSSEVSELVLEIVDNRRAEIMEIIIIMLITFEIAKSFFP